MRRRTILAGGLGLAAGASGDAHADAAITCMLVGDPSVGKTWAAYSFTENSLPQNRGPSVMEQFSAIVRRPTGAVNLSIIDNSGDHALERGRSLAYPSAGVVMIAYAIDSQPSFDAVEAYWYPELRRYAPTTPVVLAAMKLDLRGGGARTQITYEQGQAVANRIGAVAFHECSARTQAGLRNLFGAAIDLAPRDLIAPRAPIERPTLGRPRTPG